LEFFSKTTQIRSHPHLLAPVSRSRDQKTLAEMVRVLDKHSLLYDQHLIQPLLANLDGGVQELFALAGEHGVVVRDAPIYVAAAKW
jgi:hypothetical protein